jgi:teichuronic acid biosynthesis protein TuaF
VKFGLSLFTARLKRYILTLLVLSLLLGAIGWFAPAGKEITDVKAEATILLGNYENEYLNNSEVIASLLRNETTFKEYLPDVEIDREQLRISTDAPTKISFALTAINEREALDSLSELVTAFLEMDQRYYKEKDEIISESINQVQDKTVSEDLVVDQERFLYELKTKQLTLQPAMLVKDVMAIKADNRVVSQQDRALLGVMIGIMLSCLWIIYPVFIKSETDLKR